VPSPARAWRDHPTPGGAHPNSTASLLRPHPDRVSAPTLQRKPRWGGAESSQCVWGSSKPHVSQFAEKGVSIKDRFRAHTASMFHLPASTPYLLAVVVAIYLVYMALH